MSRLELNQKPALVLEAAAHVQLRGHDVIEIHQTQARIGNGDDDNFGLNFILDGPDKRRLAGADITGDHQEPLVLQDPVFQCGKPFSVLFAKPQKLGIGADIKRLFDQVVV